jgi:hypothetical protein
LFDLPAAQIHIRCPHCRTQIDVPVLDTVDHIVCPSCRSTFCLESGSTTSWGARRGRRCIGRFELLEPIGVGSFGTVYKRLLAQHHRESCRR